MYFWIDVFVALFCGWLAFSAIKTGRFIFSFATVAKSEKPALFWVLLFLVSALALRNGYQVVAAIK
jgi:hypothetical protein